MDSQTGSGPVALLVSSQSHAAVSRRLAVLRIEGHKINVKQSDKIAVSVSVSCLWVAVPSTAFV